MHTKQKKKQSVCIFSPKKKPKLINKLVVYNYLNLILFIKQCSASLECNLIIRTIIYSIRLFIAEYFEQKILWVILIVKIVQCTIVLRTMKYSNNIVSNRTRVLWCRIFKNKIYILDTNVYKQLVTLKKTTRFKYASLWSI